MSSGMLHSCPNQPLRHLKHPWKTVSYGSFTLTETDSGTDSDLDSKPDGYIVLCRTCSHCTDSDSDLYFYFCIGQESRSKSVFDSVSDNVNEPFNNFNGTSDNNDRNQWWIQEVGASTLNGAANIQFSQKLHKIEKKLDGGIPRTKLRSATGNCLTTGV